VALRLGPIRLPWPAKDAHKDDPYWHFFVNMPPADLANTVTDLIRNAPEGNVFPTKEEIHTPEINSSHVKDLARYLGADLVGIVKLDPDGMTARIAESRREGAGAYPIAVVCAVRAERDPRRSPGIGGQVPVQNGLFIGFVLSAWIRELGFGATVVETEEADKLAVRARLGSLDSKGKLVVGSLGTCVHVGALIYTDLPLTPDG
jgi:hypothetical protein